MSLVIKLTFEILIIVAIGVIAAKTKIIDNNGKEKLSSLLVDLLLPVSMLLGAVILLAADTLGRTLIPGMEIPVGIVMAVTGGPFFLYMLRKKGKVSGS